MKRLEREFFNRPTLEVARTLLGKFIVRRHRARLIEAMIVETEAYVGPEDRACHAFRGRRTKRVEPLWGEGGTVYVYLVYGIHWMLNFATAGAEHPEGVLIRGILTHAGPVPGPGRVTKHLRVTGAISGVDATSSERIWIEDRGLRLSKRDVLTGPRVGIDFAGSYWAAKPWRFRIDAERVAFQGAGAVPNSRNS
jgi:DNA-3-methyladenine glycosylase